MRGNNVRRFIENEESGFLLFFFKPHELSKLISQTFYRIFNSWILPFGHTNLTTLMVVSDMNKILRFIRVFDVIFVVI